MKGKFHINKKGEAGECNATIEECPFGSETKHYETKEEAQKAYEKENQAQALAKKQKFKKNGMRIVAIGGLLVASVNVTGCTINQSHHIFDDEKVEQFKEDSQKAKETMQEKAEKGFEEYTSGNNESSGSSAGTDPSDIYFQGDPLAPTKDEVKEAKEYLSEIVVKGERVNYDYNRERDYGYFKTGVVERAENRDITNGVFRDSSGLSRAIGGDFIDPYTGEKVTVVEGDKTDTNVDHVVPLHEVEQSIDIKNHPLSHAQKVSIANDMENLQVSGASVNIEKSDQDAAEWLPSYEPTQCKYVVSVINVKHKYDLTMDNAEKQAIRDVLDTKC